MKSIALCLILVCAASVAHAQQFQQNNNLQQFIPQQQYMPPQVQYGQQVWGGSVGQQWQPNVSQVRQPDFFHYHLHDVQQQQGFIPQQQTTHCQQQPVYYYQQPQCSTQWQHSNQRYFWQPSYYSNPCCRSSWGW